MMPFLSISDRDSITFGIVLTPPPPPFKMATTLYVWQRSEQTIKSLESPVFAVHSGKWLVLMN